ncbi:MAG: CHAD domain-containing protein [Stellaceae bacterium]
MPARLEFSADPSQLAALKAALERASTAPSGEPSLIISIFYDTPDRRLHQHGLSLCVEQHDANRVQVLRRLGSVADGSQCRDVITGDRPDPSAPETGARLSGLIEKGLRPLCRVQVRRTGLRLDVEPAVEIMATLDEGKISAAVGDATEPVCGLDLEMIEGDTAGLFDAALRLLDTAPLRITTSDNAERGYRLLGRAIEAVTAEPRTLEPSMTVEAVLQTSCRLCLRHLLRNETAALTGDAEALHQMRVAIRRLRSVLATVMSMLPAEQYQRLKDELKWLAGSLGPARDWDVFARDLLAPVRSVLHTEPDLENLVEAAERRRQAAYEAARKAIESRRYTEIILKTARWLETCGWRDQRVSEHSAPLFSCIAEMAPPLIERRWRQAMKQCKHFVGLSLDERHQVRIALKNLRYLSELLESLFDPASVKALMKRLKGLQEDLGHLNDVRTAQRLCRELARSAEHDINDVSLAAGVVVGWHLHELTNLEAKLHKDVRRFRKAKPFWRPVIVSGTNSTA